MFFSRSKQRLWEKGETSGHTLDVVDVVADCDSDTLLVTRAAARPGLPQRHPHLLRRRIAQRRDAASRSWRKLESVIAQRATEKPEASYTARLLDKGIDAVAQKVGEEGVETALAGVGGSDAEGGRGIRRPAVPPAGAAARARRSAATRGRELEARHRKLSASPRTTWQSPRA